MLNWLHDIYDQAVQLIEGQGAKIITPIVWVNLFISVYFLDIKQVAGVVDLVKDITLSAIAIAGGVVGVAKAFVSFRQQLKKDKKKTK